MVLVYSVGFGRSAPFSDEWSYTPGLVKFSWSWLMEPLNEHWLPLPKLFYLVTVRGSGMDVRSSQVLIVVVLATVALLTTWELIRRDRWALSWLVPFFVFHPAQYETFLSGINLHFALCAALLITACVLAVHDRAFGPMWSWIVVAMSLSGAVGLLYAIPMALAGLLDAKDTPRFWAWRLLALMSVAGVLGWYAFAFKHQTDTPAYSIKVAPSSALETLGVLLPHWWPAGVLVAVLALFGVVLVYASPALSRRQKLGLLACVAAVVLEVVGVGYGRGMYGPGACSQSRFASLVAPLFPILLLIVSTGPRDQLRRCLVVCVAALAVLSWPLSAHRAWAYGVAQKTSWQQFERDVEAGATVEQIIGRDGDTAINDDDVRYLPDELTTLRTWRLGPFSDYNGELRHTADPGAPRSLKLEPTADSVALEPPRFLRAVRVRFRLFSEDPHFLNSVVLKWNPPGASRAHTATIYAEGDGRLQEQLFWVWNDVETLSLSVLGDQDPRLRIEELAIYEGNASELP